MLRSRTQTLTVTALTAALIFTGCASNQKRPEVTLPGGSAFAPLAEDVAAENSDFANVDGTTTDGFDIVKRDNPTWDPNNQNVPPPVEDSFDVSMRGGDGFGDAIPMDDATGSIQQNAPLDEVSDAVEIADLEMVHFDYDRDEVKPEWQSVLDEHAAWLTEHPYVYVQVEGHCDERGTEEYNLALGQRRADSIREYLVQKGVAPHRISTVSWGKLRPLAYGQTEVDNTLNRRGMFLVYEPELETASAQ